MDPYVGRVISLVARRSGASVIPLGTCFGVRSDRFATAAHVTGPSDADLCVVLSALNSLNDYQDTAPKMAQCMPVYIDRYDPVSDLAILKPMHPGFQMGFGYNLGSTDDVSTGATIVTLGFPHADHNRVVLTQQTSTIGARIILGTNSRKLKHVVLNIQTRPGQSGGPVMDSSGSRVIAMVLGGYKPNLEFTMMMMDVDPQTLHQTTHAISAEYISELL